MQVRFWLSLGPTVFKQRFWIFVYGLSPRTITTCISSTLLFGDLRPDIMSWPIHWNNMKKSKNANKSRIKARLHYSFHHNIPEPSGREDPQFWLEAFSRSFQITGQHLDTCFGVTKSNTFVSFTYFLHHFLVFVFRRLISWGQFGILLHC